jgi:hypothetical protein
MASMQLPPLPRLRRRRRAAETWCGSACEEAACADWLGRTRQVCSPRGEHARLGIEKTQRVPALSGSRERVRPPWC